MNANDVIKIAEIEVGYLEKASDKDLDWKTENAGSKNYTKYARDLVREIGSPFMQGTAWCDVFVDWCFVKAFGKEKAKKLLGGFSAYTPTSANYFKKMGQYFKSPMVGDVVFFKNNVRICHTGLVYKADSKYVYTIEGNTSGASGLVPNGGGVKKKKYRLTSTYIAGYGRPRYDENAVMYAEPTVNLRLGSRGENVKWLQSYLVKWGYTIAVDGIFGKNTQAAVMVFQKTAGLEADGVCGKMTREALRRIS